MSVTSGLRVAVFSSGIRRISGLSEYLETSRLVYRPRRANEVDVVVGWGNKETAAPAAHFAQKNQLPYWRLEDGFLRSVASGPRAHPLSLIVDDLGIYYDAHHPSRLETLLEDGAFTPQLLARAERCIARVREARLSKYNDQSTTWPSLEDESDYVLLVDQTRGDASISGGMVDEAAFSRMLESALDEHPSRRIVIKTHPDVIAGRKRGYLTELLDSPRGARSRVRIWSENVHPHLLVERAAAVYVATSQLGFEALLYDRPVHCFGAPFYAGWGLTNDRLVVERRRARRELRELAAAAWLLYPRYLHPVRGERCEAEEVIEHLALQRRRFDENAGAKRAYGFARWKRRYVTSYLASPDGRLSFDGELRPGERALLWGTRVRPPEGAPTLHVEDGFLRSVGLGSDLTEPRSLVFDRLGLHYDPSRSSELEQLLLGATFSPDELARAARLRERIVESALSKYNAGLPESDDWRARFAGERPVVLVPGQVEDDASVRLGGAGIRTNAELLERVRAARPDAFLLYKPHPDVVSANRRGRLPSHALALADHVETRASLPACLGVCSEVHVLTSLVGFEALLRGLPVFTYGQPFYAGWGLTTDRAPLERRDRRLTLDELVAGALLRYPRYYSFRAGAFVTAEDVVFELVRDRARAAALPADAPRLVRQAERLTRWLREVLGAR